METYRTGRMVAKLLAGFGWLAATLSVVVFTFVAFGTPLLQVGLLLPPFLALFGGSITIVLISWIARAIFDMASGAERGA